MKKNIMNVIKKVLCFVIVFVVLALLGRNIFAAEYDLYIDDSYINDYDYYYDDDYYDDEYYDSSSYSQDFNWLQSLGIAIAVGLVISLIVTGIMRAGMKSVKHEYSADNYIRFNSMNIVRSQDLYLYSHTTKTALPKKDDKR